MNKLTEGPRSSAQAFFKLALVLQQERRQVLDGVWRSARHKEDFGSEVWEATYWLVGHYGS